MTETQKIESELMEALLTVRGNDGPSLSADGALPRNLLEVIDSFGMVQLLLEMEARLDVDFDLERADLETLLEPPQLIDFVKRQLSA